MLCISSTNQITDSSPRLRRIGSDAWQQATISKMEALKTSKECKMSRRKKKGGGGKGPDMKGFITSTVLRPNTDPLEVSLPLPEPGWLQEKITWETHGNSSTSGDTCACKHTY